VLANGWTSLNIRLGLATVAIAFPTLLITARMFGAVGAATVWILVNVGTTPAYLFFVHRRFLPGENRRWWSDSLMKPAVAAAIPIMAARLLMPAFLPRAWMIVFLGTVVLVATASAALACREVRHMLVSTSTWLTGELRPNV
jgi:hypothetical protein